MKIPFFDFHSDACSEFGSYNRSSGRIFVNTRPDIPVWRRKLALMHELFHWIDRTYELCLNHYSIHLMAIYTLFALKEPDLTGLEAAFLFKRSELALINKSHIKAVKNFFNLNSKNLE